MNQCALKFAVGALALASASAFAGQVSLFEEPVFHGRSASTTDAVADLTLTKFNDGVASLVVNNGTWEACTDTYFRGRCAELMPGNYSMLGHDLNGPVRSVRQIADSAVVERLVIAPDPAAVGQAVVAAAPPIVISPGQSFVISSAPTPVVVSPASPQVVVTTPVVAGATVIAPSPGPVVSTAPLLSGRAVIYQFPNFGGPSAVVQYGRAPDLDWANFRYAASSLRVESGRWLACSDIGYQGDCAVFGPGEYPVLIGLLNQGIVSLRQIS